MALYASSCETSSVTTNGSVVEITTTGKRDATYGIRCGLRETSGVSTNYLGTGQSIGGPFSEVFWHRGFFCGQDANTYTTGRTLLAYRNATGTDVFRCQIPATSTLQFQYWNGTAWTNIGATVAVSPTVLYKFDLRIDCGAGFAFYLTNVMETEGSLVLSGAASMPLVTAIDEIRAYNTRDTGNSVIHSEWIWGDEPTIGHRYALAAPASNGADTAGSSDYTAVDETITSDADLTTLAASGDAETYKHTAMSLPSSGWVKAVQVEARLRRVTGGAQNVKARLRLGGVAYDASAAYAGIATTFSPYRARWASNPAGGDWTLSAAANLANEFGMVAQA